MSYFVGTMHSGTRTRVLLEAPVRAMNRELPFLPLLESAFAMEGRGLPAPLAARAEAPVSADIADTTASEEIYIGGQATDPASFQWDRHVGHAADAAFGVPDAPLFVDQAAETRPLFLRPLVVGQLIENPRRTGAPAVTSRLAPAGRKAADKKAGRSTRGRASAPGVRSAVRQTQPSQPAPAVPEPVAAPLAQAVPPAPQPAPVQGMSAAAQDKKAARRAANRAAAQAMLDDAIDALTDARPTHDGAEGDMKRKGHDVFLAAVEDHRNGRKAQAHTNAMLALLYDKENWVYRLAADFWGQEVGRAR